MLQQIKKHTVNRVTAVVGIISAILLVSVAPALSQNVTQGYSTDARLQRGTIVSLDAEDPTKVVPANPENEDRLQGVVVNPTDSTFTLSDSNEKTFVANVGRFDVFVSTEAGLIQPGDFLTVSNITGIAMKSGETNRFTIGKAIEGFDGDINSISTSEITDSLGNVNTVGIGRILVDIGVGSNPLFKPTESNLPGFLQRATEAIAGKEVSPVRVYIGLFILIAAASLSGSLLYAGIRSGLISIGRNPLSKKSITKSLFQIILTSIIIFLIGLFGVYLLLRL